MNRNLLRTLLALIGIVAIIWGLTGILTPDLNLVIPSWVFYGPMFILGVLLLAIGFLPRRPSGEA
jgi:uncharacterized membrane protein HdeD (DUF308 family)